MSGCDKKCCANCAHCYETKEVGSYGCTQNVFKPGDLLDDEIHGELQDGDTPKRDWLDMPGGFRLSSFHVAGRTTFVGARKNHGDNGGNIYKVEVSREPKYETATFSIERNGGLLAEGSLFVGRWKAAEQAAVGMLKGYLARIETDRRHNKRNKKNRKARKAAAEAAAQIEPELAIPPRPGLPEDDE